MGIRRDLRHQCPDDRSEGRLGERTDGVHDRGQELLSGVPGLGHRDVRASELHQELKGKLLARPPVPVDGGLAHTSPGSYMLQAETREPFLDEQRTCRVEDGTVRTVAAWSTSVGDRCRAGRCRRLVAGRHPARLRNAAYHCIETRRPATEPTLLRRRWRPRERAPIADEVPRGYRPAARRGVRCWAR